MATDISRPNVRAQINASNEATIYELEVNENLRAGYISIGGTEYTQPAVSHLICSPAQTNTITYVLPETLSTKGGAMAADGTGVLSWLPKKKTFFNRVEILDHHEHILTGTTTSGRATFYLTKDGKSTGTPLFSAIYKISSNVVYATSDPTETAFMSTNLVSTDFKTVQVNCACISLALIGLVRVPQGVPNGTSVSIAVTGKPV